MVEFFSYEYERTLNERKRSDRTRTPIFAFVNSFTSDPVELLIDCGAEVCIISDQKTLKSKQAKKPIYRITGVTGNDSSFNTKGSLIGNFITDDNNDWLAEIHLVDDKYTGNFDGYVGLDFLKKHHAIIDTLEH